MAWTTEVKQGNLQHHAQLEIRRPKVEQESCTELAEGVDPGDWTEPAFRMGTMEEEGLCRRPEDLNSWMGLELVHLRVGDLDP